MNEIKTDGKRERDRKNVTQGKQRDSTIYSRLVVMVISSRKKKGM